MRGEYEASCSGTTIVNWTIEEWETIHLTSLYIIIYCILLSGFLKEI
jgi:hypothetical protein